MDSNIHSGFNSRLHWAANDLGNIATMARSNLKTVPESAPIPASELSSAKPNFLVVTAHDYRTPRRTTMHFIADELAERGTTRFFSLRYSALSRLRPDGRHPIADRANQLETIKGVDCFLWKTNRRPS